MRLPAHAMLPEASTAGLTATSLRAAMLRTRMAYDSFPEVSTANATCLWSGDTCGAAGGRLTPAQPFIPLPANPWLCKAAYTSSPGLQQGIFEP